MSRKNSQEDSELIRRTSESSSNNDDNAEGETYTVKDGDTFNKIAAMYDTTPSKLAQINKMSGSRYVFPGQVLKLPPPEPPKPPTPEPVIDKDVVDLSNNFVGMNVRHLTEGRGIVEGTLLLTGKLVMFDPYAHNALVAESSVDKYQIILPMSLVVNAVILTEFARNSDENPSLIYHKEATAAEDDNAEQSPKKPETPMYLRLRLGQPIGSEIKRDEMINTYGDFKVLPDYWFLVTPSRASTMHDFFNNVHMYGVLDVMAIERAGLELVREGREAIEAEAGRTVSRATVAKLDKQHLSFASVDFGSIAPIVGDSELMEKKERIYLAKLMPPKLECHTWLLLFSTSTDGFSLQNMMRKLSERRQSTGLLLVLSDLNKNVFGAFMSGVPSMGNEHFEGTGETFLFKLQPAIKAFKWTGENNFFYRVINDSVIVGSSKGKFGLWIDRDLNKGRSQSCATFDNEPLAGSEDFTVKTLECWTFDMVL